MLSAFAPPLAAQTLNPAPMPAPPLQVTAVLSEVYPVIAMAPDGGWIVAAGRTFRHEKLPSEMLAKLNEFTSAGRNIDAAAFTPDGRGWTVVAGSKSWTRNVGGSGSDTYHTVLNARLDGTRRVRSVAFNPVDWSRKQGYVIVWSDGSVNHRDIPDEMARKLDEYRRARVDIRSVAFTRQGGWSIIVAGRSYTRNVGGPDGERNYHPQLTGLEEEGRQVRAVTFDPRSTRDNQGWAIVTDAYTRKSRIPARMEGAMAELFVLATASSGTGQGGAGTSTTRPSIGGSGGSSRAPTVTLNASPATACVGDEITLTWKAANADRVELSPPGEVVALEGRRTITAGSDPKFTARAINGETGRTATADRTVRINRAPNNVSITKVAVVPRGASPTDWRVATVEDRDVNRDCGRFTRITRVSLASPSQMVSTAFVRIHFQPADGQPSREFIFGRDRMTTDKFDGLDPRGTWKLIYGPHTSASPTLSFRITAEQGQ